MEKSLKLTKTMKKTDENYIEKGGVLSVFCVDNIDTRARVTFDSSEVNGIRLTYWQPEAPDSVDAILDDIFTILFENVVKARRLKMLGGEEITKL